ncbi:Uncharacterised protein [Vibrio paracholerae]|uniref:hypothetical protein n=1 Tax=Vibrio paracholerae TaxID=650003 RepID=UPI000E5C48C0|nr:hypothetical protein [Vibrio paracholerae]SYZ83184.1 Uncharacterised protein [Vibrio paracholerae]
MSNCKNIYFNGEFSENCDILVEQLRTIVNSGTFEEKINELIHGAKSVDVLVVPDVNGLSLPKSKVHWSISASGSKTEGGSGGGTITVTIGGTF